MVNILCYIFKRNWSSTTCTKQSSNPVLPFFHRIPRPSFLHSSFFGHQFLSSPLAQWFIITEITIIIWNVGLFITRFIRVVYSLLTLFWHTGWSSGFQFLFKFGIWYQYIITITVFWRCLFQFCGKFWRNCFAFFHWQISIEIPRVECIRIGYFLSQPFSTCFTFEIFAFWLLLYLTVTDPCFWFFRGDFCLCFYFRHILIFILVITWFLFADFTLFWFICIIIQFLLTSFGL